MRFPDRARRVGGFTLLEVMVALALAGVVLLGARALLEQVGAGSEAIAAGAVEADRDANAERTLRDLLSRVEVRPSGGPFAGDARGARFTTWCDVPAGWQERCVASLGLVKAGDDNVLAVEARGALLPVRRGFAAGELLYLTSADRGGSWVRDWNSGVEPPLAVGVVMDADTLILRIGERG